MGDRDLDVWKQTLQVRTKLPNGLHAGVYEEDLAAAIEDSLEEDRPQGQAVMLLSDGVHNAPGGSARLRESLAKAKALAAAKAAAAEEAEVAEATDTENSSISLSDEVAENKTDETKKIAAVAEELGCKKFIPEVGMTVTVSCE